MQFIEHYKALIITTLITSILVLSAINITILKNNSQVAESYYEVEPETIEELKKQLEEVEKITSKNTTNQAYNNDAEYKRMMKNFKTVDLNDFEEHAKQTDATTPSTASETYDLTNNSLNVDNNSVNEQDLSSYNKVSDILAMRSAKRRSKASSGDNTSNNIGSYESSNPNSNIQFSLKDRKMRNNPIPIYLCELGGKIVVNIKVNHLGIVTLTNINTAASTSNNECLTDHALEYAADARFTPDKKASQIGTITFYFKEKN